LEAIRKFFNASADSKDRSKTGFLKLMDSISNKSSGKKERYLDERNKSQRCCYMMFIVFEGLGLYWPLFATVLFLFWWTLYTAVGTEYTTIPLWWF